MQLQWQYMFTKPGGHNISAFALVAFSPSLFLYIFFGFGLIFVGKYIQKMAKKKYFDCAQGALAHFKHKPFYSYFGK